MSLNGVWESRAYATREGCKIDFIKSDVEHMPFKNETFDLLWYGLILHHFLGRSKLSKELARIAKGHLFALEANALEPMTFLKFNILNPLLKLSHLTPNQRALFPNKVKKIFREQDFFGFEFSWINIHVPYKGLIGVATKVFSNMCQFLPMSYRSNKFVMSCNKLNRW